MTALIALASIVVLLAIVRVLARYLGWPTNRAAVGRWLGALVVAWVLVLALPEIVTRVPTITLPRFDPGTEPLPWFLAVLGLATIGYGHWRYRQAHPLAADDRTRLVPRRRALPPAPRDRALPRGEEE